MQRRNALPALIFLTTACMLAGCGGSVTSNDAHDGGDAGAVVHVTPPARPASGASGSVTKWFALRTLRLGTEPAQDWMSLGFDLDGLATTADDSAANTTTCARPVGSPPALLTDGNGGIDNNFGGHFMQSLRALWSDVETSANASISDGTETMLLRIEGLSETGASDSVHVPGAIYLAHGLASPKHDGKDRWPVLRSSVIEGDLGKPLVTFPDGYLSGGIWVSGALQKTMLSVPIHIGDKRIRYVLDAAEIAFDVAGHDHGVIAGYTIKASLDRVLDDIATVFDVCPGNAAYDQVKAALELSFDLSADAPGLQKIGAPCDALSTGVGFTVEDVAPPTEVVDDPPSPPSPCH